MRLSRKSFVTIAALGAPATALAFQSNVLADDPGKPEIHFHVLRADEYDRARMMSTFAQQKPHKQVFQVDAIVLVPGIASAYMHMQNSLNAHEFSFGYGRGSLATLGVLLGPAIILGLDDAMWSKYGFGKAFSVANTNVYYKATSNLQLSAAPDDPDGIYQDWSAEAVLHRGGSFMLCHNAMTFVASICATSAHSTTEAVLSEFERHLLPGYQIVPAGVAAVQLAQQHGWTLFTIT